MQRHYSHKMIGDVSLVTQDKIEHSMHLHTMSMDILGCAACLQLSVVLSSQCDKDRALESRIFGYGTCCSSMCSNMI